MPEQESTLDATFGTGRWRRACALSRAARRDFLRDLFLEQLRASAGAIHVRAFEIPSADGHQGYYLFFATGDDVGLLKMKEAMWKADPLFGEAYRDMTDPSQPVLFEPRPDTGPLALHLKETFGERVFTIEDAEHTTLVDTAFLPNAHLKTMTLKPLELAGYLRDDPASRNSPATFPKRTRMRFLRPRELEEAGLATHPMSLRRAVDRQL
jgi:hypothetical protein